MEFDILSQHAGLALCTLNDDGWFQMRPDIIVTSRSQKWIVDAKWKRLGADRGRNYDLNQADFYQMFACGQKYLDGTGDMFLVYPNVNDFPNLPAAFRLSNDLRLHVIPFDLETRSAPYTFLQIKAGEISCDDPLGQGLMGAGVPA